MNFQFSPVSKNIGPGVVFRKYWIVFFLIIYLPISYLIYGHAKLFDDNYIYLQYAKHFIEHGELSFNIGVKSYAFTSPLWEIFYIITYYIFRTTYIAPLLSLSFAIITLLVCYYFLKDFINERTILFPVIILIAFDPIFIKHIYNGMETTLVFLFSYTIIAGIILTPKIRNELFLGLIFGLFFLVRPESMIISTLTVIYLVLNKELKLKGLIKIILMAVIICLPWYLFAYLYFGKILPDTFGAKGGDYTIGRSFFKNIFDIVKIFGGNYIFLLLISLLSVSNIVRFFNTGKLKYTFVFLVVILYILFYSLFISAENIYARYLAITSPVITLLFILFNLYDSFNLQKTKTRFFIAAFLLLVSSVFYSRFDKQLVDNANMIQDSVVTWAQNNTPQNSYISYATIGKLGYFTDRKVFDPQGLINRDISKYYLAGNIEDYYILKRPDYLIGIPGATLSKLRKYGSIDLKKEFIFDIRFLLRQRLSTHSDTDTIRIYKINYW